MSGETKNTLPPIESAKAQFSEQLQNYVLGSVVDGLSTSQVDQVRKLVVSAIRETLQKKFGTLFKVKQADWVLFIVDDVVKAVYEGLNKAPLKGRFTSDKNATNRVQESLTKKNRIGTNAPIVNQLLRAVGVLPIETIQKQELSAPVLVPVVISSEVKKTTVQNIPETQKTEELPADDFIQKISGMAFSEIKTYLQDRLSSRIVIDSDRRSNISVSDLNQILIKCEDAYVNQTDNVALKLDVWRLAAPAMFDAANPKKADIFTEICNIIIGKAKESKIETPDLVEVKILTTEGTPFIMPTLPIETTWQEKKSLMVGAITSERRIDEKIFLQNLEALKRKKLN